MLVAFLVSTRKIHTTMSGYQVLRSVLQFLGEMARLEKAKDSTHPGNPLMLSGRICFFATRQEQAESQRQLQLEGVISLGPWGILSDTHLLWFTSATTDLTVNGISLCFSSDPSLVSRTGLSGQGDLQVRPQP